MIGFLLHKGKTGALCDLPMIRRLVLLLFHKSVNSLLKTGQYLWYNQLNQNLPGLVKQVLPCLVPRPISIERSVRHVLHDYPPSANQKLSDLSALCDCFGEFPDAGGRSEDLHPGNAPLAAVTAGEFPGSAGGDQDTRTVGLCPVHA